MRNFTLTGLLLPTHKHPRAHYGRQNKHEKCPSLPALVLTLPPKWALLRWSSPPPSAFSLLPLLPSLEPGTGGSHPGNVRRQGPPRRSSELGHPIRRKSVSNFTMAGPAANKHHLLRMSVPPCLLPVSLSRSVSPLYPLHPSPLRSKQNVTEHPKSKPVAPPCRSVFAASRSRDTQLRVCVCARVRA